MPPSSLTVASTQLVHSLSMHSSHSPHSSHSLTHPTHFISSLSLTKHTHTKQQLMYAICRALLLRHNQVHVSSRRVGGGFGGKVRQRCVFTGVEVEQKAGRVVELARLQLCARGRPVLSRVVLCCVISCRADMLCRVVLCRRPTLPITPRQLQLQHTSSDAR